jgi:RNA-directed DNA polymerase
VYLHWFEKVFYAAGGPADWAKAQLVRYADDMVILCRTEAEARRELAHLQSVLHGLGLSLNEDKTRVVEAREGFDFLGFSFRPGTYTRRGQKREILIKVPRVRAVTSMQAKIKKAVKEIPLGETVAEAVMVANTTAQDFP